MKAFILLFRARLKQFRILLKLTKEAGRTHIFYLSLLSIMSKLADITGLGLLVGILLRSRSEADPFPLATNVPLVAELGILLTVFFFRGQLQAMVAIRQERLRSCFTDELRQQVLRQVLAASSTQLSQLSRGNLLGLLMADINRTVLSLDSAVRLMQASVALIVYLLAVLLVGKTSAWPLLLALLSTTAAALLQPSGSWHLGQIQSRLNASLQRTVSDGLHGLKAVRAAAAESWLLTRFAQETAQGRWLQREQVRRRSGFNVWRDTLVIAVVGLWILIQGETLKAEVLATALLLAYRAGSSLSEVVQAQRLCLGSLPGYVALCHQRQQLQPNSLSQQGSSLANSEIHVLGKTRWRLLKWQHRPKKNSKKLSLKLQEGRLVVITGPSGSGKTQLLDRICGLLAEEHSEWMVECDEQRSQLSGHAGARQLHELIAYAPQDAVLLEASLRDNLLLGREQSEEAIETWLGRLGLSHLLLRPGGLDASMHLAQDPFSGGEIHRLGLLRAWLRDLPVEVLDEPTAFLDAESAQTVRSVIQERVPNRLILVSTHDPELIKQADQVIRLEPGDGSAVFRHATTTLAKAIEPPPSVDQPNLPAA